MEITLCTCIWEVPGWDFGRDSDYSGGYPSPSSQMSGKHLD
jgi:hypothetical protein